MFTDFAPTIRPLDKPGSGNEALTADAPVNPSDGLTEEQAAAAARSRSTSAGSSAPLSSTGRTHSPPPLTISVEIAAHRLPEFDCPSPFVVDGWLAPPLEATAGTDQKGNQQHRQQQQPQAVMTVPQLGLRSQTPQSVPPPPLLPPVLAPTAHGAAAQALPPPPAQAPSLQNAEAMLGVAELGTSDLPTMGSEGHRYGSCKPCAFVHTKGCGNGVQCQFCHLCSPGEKKRRQRERFNLQHRTGTGGTPGSRGPVLTRPGEHTVEMNNAIW